MSNKTIVSDSSKPIADQILSRNVKYYIDDVQLYREDMVIAKTRLHRNKTSKLLLDADYSLKDAKTNMDPMLEVVKIGSDCGKLNVGDCVFFDVLSLSQVTPMDFIEKDEDGEEFYMFPCHTIAVICNK